MRTRARTLRPLVAITAALLAAALVAACGNTIDTDQLEQDLVDQLSSEAGVEASEVSTECPGDEEAEEGNQFECILTAPNGDEVTVEVTITDGGDGFEAVVPPEQFEQQGGGGGGS
jgi:hypothetical protein